MFLLDSLHESLSRKVEINITKVPLKSEKQIFHQKSLEVWKSNFEKQYSPFTNLFFGIFHIQIICGDCGNISNNFETFNTLKGVIHIGEKPTLLECIHGELNEEIIDDYACDKCSPKRCKAVRKTKVWKLPKTLIVVLKRFNYDGRKIHTPIHPFGPNIMLDSLYSASSPNKKESEYTLRSIVDHHGSSTGGHYTAQAKHRGEEKWYVYDDQSVHSIDTPVLGDSSDIFFLEAI
jgi:ubiquitin C-terminal hydrolase